MNKSGPIIFIEDDLDDQEITIEVFKALNYNNELLFFGEGKLALSCLTATNVEPFIIFSDINMPKLTGMELFNKVHENEDLRLKSIPYLFYTGRAAGCRGCLLLKLYRVFFVKPSSYDELKAPIHSIVDH